MTQRSAPVDVVVEVGGWEHECCGDAVERDQLVGMTVVPFLGPDGAQHLAMTSHGGLDLTGVSEVRGRVVDLEVVRDDGTTEQVLRVPSGRALCGWDSDDDGHLEDPWTEERLPDGREFRVTVRTSTVRP